MVNRSAPLDSVLEAFLVSTLGVAIAEIGDKTQLLTLFLVAKFRRPAPIILGILLSTLVNHGVSAWLGDWLAGLMANGVFEVALGMSFIAVGLWMLIPDKEGGSDSPVLGLGAFVATLVLFFVAEIGDKTQVATVLLAARFDALWGVILGTTAGMMLANLPVIWGGRWLIDHLPVRAINVAAAILFIVLGVLTLLTR